MHPPQRPTWPCLGGQSPSHGQRSRPRPAHRGRHTLAGALPLHVGEVDRHPSGGVRARGRRALPTHVHLCALPAHVREVNIRPPGVNCARGRHILSAPYRTRLIVAYPYCGCPSRQWVVPCHFLCASAGACKIKLFWEGRAWANTVPLLQSTFEGISRGWVGYGLVEGYSQFDDAGVSRECTTENPPAP